MSTCHQAHNIPWSLLTDLLYIRGPEYGAFDKLYSNFHGREQSQKQSNEMKHFVNKFAEAIRSFAATKRATYEKTIELDENKVIPDDMIGMFVNMAKTERSPTGRITEEHQTLTWWRAEAQSPSFNLWRNDHCPTVIRELHLRDRVPQLLFLAQHFGNSLLGLRRLRESDNTYHYGTNRVYEDALALYIIINVYLLFNLYGTAAPIPAKWDDAIQSFYHDTIPSGWPAALSLARASVFEDDLVPLNNLTDIYTPFFRDGNLNLQDSSRIKGFLNRLWRLMYISEVYIRECGGEIDWEKEIKRVLKSYLNLELEG